MMMRRAASALLAGSWLLTTPAIADDGGVEPTFFNGAGIRALAMGGAFTAVADDASAPTWNPAGIGLLQRAQFQASHTNLFGLGFTEQYASFVYPSWRYGVGSVTFRQIGTDDIDVRDDRNLVLDDALDAGETEIRFGYGRQVSSHVSVGGTVNVYRQSVAGYSGSGIGMDAGVHVRPLAAFGYQSGLADRTRLGLVVKNLIQPSVQLDQESVRDPKGLRLGLAYDHRGPFGKGLLAAVDVEKTDDTSVRLQAGVEFKPLRMFALRGSVGTNGLTAGTGVEWNAMDIDYAFEDNPLGTIHRFGVAWAFGASLDERRAHFVAERDADLNRRLAVAVEERTKSRIDGLIEQAEAALSRRDPDTSLRTLSMAEVIAPQHPRVLELQAAAMLVKGLDQERAGDPETAAVSLSRAVSLDPQNMMAIDALSRVRAESDKRAARSTEIRGLYARALDAFVAEDLTSSRDDFARVLALAPNDGEARGMLRRVEAAMTKRAERLVDRAREHIEAKDFDRADAALAEARQLDADATGLDAGLASLGAARRAELLATEVRESRPADTAPKPAADPAPSVLTEQQLRQTADLYRRGLDAVQARRHDEAIRYWELVWAVKADYQQVDEYLNREYVTRGMERFAAGRLRDAVVDWESALRVKPGDERAQGYLNRARTQLARYEEIVTESKTVEP